MGALVGDLVGLDWVGNLVRLDCNFVGIWIWLGFGWLRFWVGLSWISCWNGDWLAELKIKLRIGDLDCLGWGGGLVNQGI